jgi:hypothetical protein
MVRDIILVYLYTMSVNFAIRKGKKANKPGHGQGERMSRVVVASANGRKFNKGRWTERARNRAKGEQKPIWKFEALRTACQARETVVGVWRRF